MSSNSHHSDDILHVSVSVCVCSSAPPSSNTLKLFRCCLHGGTTAEDRDKMLHWSWPYVQPLCPKVDAQKHSTVRRSADSTGSSVMTERDYFGMSLEIIFVGKSCVIHL